MMLIVQKKMPAKMIELDEQSDLGHQDHLSIGEVVGSTHLESVVLLDRLE